jgi:hypothetical protein
MFAAGAGAGFLPAESRLHAAAVDEFCAPGARENSAGPEAAHAKRLKSLSST